MPRNLSEFTRCAPPGAAYAMSQAPNWVVQLLWAFAMGALVGVQGLISAIFLGLSSTMFACVVTGPSLIGFVIGAWSFFKDWYYNKRLMCVQKDVCAAGTLVGEPYDSLDGDRKIDLLVAPLAVIDSEQSLIETVDEMRSSLPNV